MARFNDDAIELEPAWNVNLDNIPISFWLINVSGKEWFLAASFADELKFLHANVLEFLGIDLYCRPNSRYKSYLIFLCSSNFSTRDISLFL